jgi:short-subunit dehydrogenase
MKQGTVYMITGAAMGIGAAAAEYVVEQGGRVAVCDIDEATGRALCDRLGEAAEFIHLNVRESESWERAVERAWEIFGRVDVLVSNAGIAVGGLCHELPLDKHRACVEVNLLGPIYGMHYLIPKFLEQGSGHIVNVGSFAAFSPMSGLGIYSATKHGLRAFTHSSDIELKDTPVSVSLVCPSAVETPMLDYMAKRDEGVIVFTQKPMPPRKMAEAIVRAVEEKKHEILVPGFLGAVLRIVGLFPALLKRSSAKAIEQGKVEAEKRRQASS